VGKLLGFRYVAYVFFFHIYTEVWIVVLIHRNYFFDVNRFLIVIDDIRDIPSWEVIKCALVDSGRGSRIITTSRVLNVAESSGEVLELMPLSIDGSKELFYATLCGHKVQKSATR